ncbi:MAG: hypothetical protein JXK07_16340 [Spirochaetes bacterium]|nr:hypothetical protein [Spirochaetota bacterium]MBN2771154.1 hypothetical protein [Spirochaetota bacterium]
MTRRKIQDKLCLKGEKCFRETYLQPAVEMGLLETIIPDKHNSRLQK